MTATEHDTARRTLADDDDTPFGRFPTALLVPGEVVHRYQVRRLLGTGGAGQVYAAFDPDLDREVALKIINAYGGGTTRDTSGAQRLVREARAMASLSHPNVAEVHHVGRLDGGVFIAMELLPGGTLGDWLLDSSRSWQAVLDKFVAAGRGLSHAHTAGIVHRDFKPDNVLLTADGEPRVLDFGLARREDRPRLSESTAAETLQSAAVQDALFSAPDPSFEAISGASSLLGTPAYMAPEQHLGEVVDARADQFGFAVALYEGLFGRRPYQARAVAELALAVTTGEPEPPPEDRPVPRRIWRVLRRALARQPDDRWPDMASMLTALTADRRPARRWTLGAVSLVGVAAAVIVVAPPSDATQPPCEVGAARVDRVWNHARHAAIDTAFSETKLLYASAGAQRVGQRVETWSNAWREAYVGVCQAAGVSETTGRTADLQMRCLSRQLDEVEALVDVLENANDSVVRRAADLATRVPDTARCDGDQPLGPDAPTSKEAADALDSLHREVAEIDALKLAARFEEGLAKAETLYARTQDDPLARARAMGRLRLGTMLEAAGKYERALPLLTDAEHIAVASELPDVAIEAGLQLTYLTGYRLARPDEGLRWARTAHAAIERIGGNADADVRLLSSEAAIHERRGEYQAAFANFDQARTMREAADGPTHPDLGRNLVNMGLMLHRLGRQEEAEEHLLRALKVITETQSDEHPLFANALNNLGIVLEHQGRLDEATTRYQAALDLGERLFGHEHPSIVSTLNNLGNIATAQGRPDEAIALIRRGLAIREQAFGADHPRTAFSVRALGTLLGIRRQNEEALRMLRRALESYESALGPEHPEVAVTLEHLGHVLTAEGLTSQALVTLRRSLEIRLATLGSDHRAVAMSQLRIGQAHARAGEMAKAKHWFALATPVLARELPTSDATRAAALAGPQVPAETPDKGR